MGKMIRILSTLAVQGALPGLITRFEQAAGAKVAADFAPTNGLLARIKAGEMADVAILTREGIDGLVRLGILDGRTVVDLVRSLVGIAVKAGAPRPDIATPEALKRTLLQAGSIAYSKIGASGVFFAGLIQRLGISDAVNAKATIIPSGLTAELAARGEVEMAVQQLSELKLVAGIDIVGPLPASLQTPTVFAAAAFSASGDASAALGFLRLLTSAEAAAAFRAAGLEPAR
jgi:molybdate transport system substrate-binding protein